MIPNVTVPMNFGRNLLNSPTHSNLVLNTSQGGQVMASSVILSFNSPVIGHMTGELHMTSVDMLEFTEEAVRVFVDAAYSGTAEEITRRVFRDVNKMSQVFEVSWLAEKCTAYFKGVADSISTASYPDVLFLFEEAAYVFEMAKSRQLVSVAIEKIQELKCKQQFLYQYLENAERLSTKKLDLVIELAGSEVNVIVQNMIRQLSEQVQGAGFPVSTRYLLDNLDLYLCRKSYNDLFDDLFTILENASHDFESLRWVLQLHKKSLHKKEGGVSSTVVSVAGSSVTCVARCNDIPNLYHEFDMNLSLDELLDWLSTSDEVTNVLIALEAFRTLVFHKKIIKDVTSLKTFIRSGVTNKLVQIMRTRSWLKLPHYMRSLRVALYGDINITPLCVSDEEKCSYVDIQCINTYKNALSLLSGEATLVFQFQHPDVTSCDKPEKCGFVLKTVPGEGKLRKIKLCTETEDYHDQLVHFHDQIRAENMHLYFVSAGGNDKCLRPLSWLGWYNTEKCSSHGDLNVWNKIYEIGRFRVLYEVYSK